MPVIRFDRIPVEPCEEAIAWPTGGVVVNSVFDFIMEHVRSNEMLRRYQAVPIPDLVERLEASSTPLSASVAGTLTASRGALSDLTSLRRAGDLTLSTEDGILYVSGPVTLATLRATFRRWSLKAGFVKKSGDKLDIDVGQNMLNIYVKIRFDGPECDVRLEAVRVCEFSDVSVDISGLSVLNSVGRRLAKWFLIFFNGYVKNIAEDYSKTLVNGAVKDKSMVSRLMGCAIAGMVLRTADDNEQDTYYDCESDSRNSTINNGDGIHD